ncbi:MAG: phage holin family protein [Chloroflexota bacterium]|nr:phage holin family protein [Chloroflexota bacterium]
MTRNGRARGESILGHARELVGGLVGLARMEVQHGRREIGAMLATTRGAAIRIGIGVAFLILALIAFVSFVVLGIAALTGLPSWLVALIAFVVFALVAGFLAYSGVRRVRLGPPEETIASVKEDIAWAKRLLRRG